MTQKGEGCIRSTCPYCGVGCGVLLRPDGVGGLSVEGDPEHPANYGRLCSKGLALGETTDLEGRLLTPVVNGKEAAWDTALDLVADKFKAAIAEHGPDSVAFYVSGQLLTEDYYIANKLMKGFIGSANIDTNSRLCMASTVAGHKRAFGTDTVPGTYEDLELADLVVLTGSNLAWCHPVLYQRLAKAREEHGTKVVVIDPRRTSSCDIADLHLKIAPGADVALFNGLLAHLNAAGKVDEDFVGSFTEGFEAALEAAEAADLSVCGIDQADIDAFYKLFEETEKTVTIFSQGVNQSTSGADKVNAILNCHLATGRIGKPGLGPFSVTGQPNAMGGRETGGLANMLAAHLDLENEAHRDAVAEFWNAPNLASQAGLKAVDLFKATKEGKIKAIWIACTNPVVSLPEADLVAEALKTCDFVAVSEIMADTDSTRLADVILPATGWGEKDGTVTNSDRTISRQRPALPKPGAAKHDWEIYAEVGRRMGWEKAFTYETPADLFREHAALSEVAGSFGRDFDISAVKELSDAEYETFEPKKWPLSDAKSGGRFFADGKFYTPSGKARLLPVTHREPETKTGPKYPYRLNSGRVRDQWHTMTRTAKSSRLSRHLAEPFLQLHPEDALEIGLRPADLALVKSPTGNTILRVLITDDVARGVPFAPMHWTGINAPASRIGTVIQAAVDPVSGQPESKASVVAIEKYHPKWHGFAVSSKAFTPKERYWAQMRCDGGWRADIAGDGTIEDWTEFAKELFELVLEPAVLEDPNRGQTRLSFSDENGLQAALFVGPEPVEVSRDFVASQLGAQCGSILAARPGADRPDPGPIVCSCLNVGRNTLLSGIAEVGPDLARLCETTGAGTNCGSCRPEIANLIERVSQKTAAE